MSKLTLVQRVASLLTTGALNSTPQSTEYAAKLPGAAYFGTIQQ